MSSKPHFDLIKQQHHACVRARLLGHLHTISCFVSKVYCLPVCTFVFHTFVRSFILSFDRSFVRPVLVDSSIFLTFVFLTVSDFKFHENQSRKCVGKC